MSCTMALKTLEIPRLLWAADSDCWRFPGLCELKHHKVLEFPRGEPGMLFMMELKLLELPRIMCITEALPQNITYAALPLRS